MSFPIKAKIFIYIYMNRNFNSGHLFINPPGKRSVDSQPVKMKPKTRAMQGIWSWLGNRTSLKGKLCIETNGIADPCLFVFCVFVCLVVSHILTFHQFQRDSTKVLIFIHRFWHYWWLSKWINPTYLNKIIILQEPHFCGRFFETHSLLISTFSH